jgi:MFS family permease
MQLLTVGWLVRELTDGLSASAFLVVTIGLNTLPGLIFSPWAGVLGDKLDRRKLVIFLQSFMAILAFGFALLVLSGYVRVWHTFAYVLISGTTFTVTKPLRHVLIANTVAHKDIGNAFATNVLTITGTRAIGPFIGGILIASLGFFWNFTFEALLYVGTVLFFIPMKTPFSTNNRSNKQDPHIVKFLIGGLAYVWKDDRTILLLVLLSLIPNVVLQPFMFLLPVFTVEVLLSGPDVGGYLLAMTGTGGVFCALLLSSLGFPLKKGYMVLTTAIISSIFVISLGFSYSLFMALLMLGLLSFSQCIFRTTNGTLIQTLVPDQLRARVTSLQDYGRAFVVPSCLVVGWIAGTTSVQLAMIIMGLTGFALGVLCLVLFARVRHLA